MFRRGDVPRRWVVVDAGDQALGRVASVVATRLRGKHSPLFTPYEDVGEHVIVVNADKVRLTGSKAEQKYYHSHSGYHGGARQVPIARRRAERPEYIITHAVRGMLPKNRLGRRLLRKLRVYTGSEHPHAAQTPEEIRIETRR